MGYNTLGDIYRKEGKMPGKRRKPGGLNIKIKPKNQGKLRRATRTKKGSNIPVAKLQQLKKSKNPTTRKRATFALNARKWNKGKKK